jgi:hypothetical protein
MCNLSLLKIVPLISGYKHQERCLSKHFIFVHLIAENFSSTIPADGMIQVNRPGN